MVQYSFANQAVFGNPSQSYQISFKLDQKVDKTKRVLFKTTVSSLRHFHQTLFYC